MVHFVQRAFIKASVVLALTSVPFFAASGEESLRDAFRVDAAGTGHALQGALDVLAQPQAQAISRLASLLLNDPHATSSPDPRGSSPKVDV